MKYILLSFLLISKLSFAGLIVSTDKDDYLVGEKINVSIGYEVDDAASFTEITDFSFDFTWSSDNADYLGYQLASPYDTPTWFGDFYEDGFGFLALDVFDTNPFDGISMDTWSLISFELEAVTAGNFHFELSNVRLQDFNLFSVYEGQGFTEASITANDIAQVPEPTMAWLFIFSLGLFGLVKAKRNKI